jgi:amino acid permease
MNNYSFWKAVGIIAGMIIGSGMFVIPYAVHVSGLWWSLASAIVALIAVLAIHLAYGEIVANASASHRLPGYVRLYLGSIPSHIESVAQVFSFNLILLIYGILGGKFLSILLSGWLIDPIYMGGVDKMQWILSIVVMLICALAFMFHSVRKVSAANLLLVVPLVLSIVGISFFALSQSGGFAVPRIGTEPFLAFSIFLFSLGGLSVIADAFSLFSRDHDDRVGAFRASILMGTLVPFFLYVLFAIGMLWIFGASISENFLVGVGEFLGAGAMRFGALIGFLAIVTSYIPLGYDLRRLYELDTGIPSVLAWIGAAFVPLALFLLGVDNFVTLMSLVGGIFVVIDGIFVIFILRKMRALGLVKRRFLPLGSFAEITLILLFLFSAGYEIMHNILK